MTSSATVALELEADGLNGARRIRAIVAVGLVIAMAVIDGTITNVALPTIASDLHASPAASIWIVNAYQLSIAMALLPLASLGEILGYGRIYRAGVITFIAGSLACALSPSLSCLALARVVQGLGAAGIMSVNAALIRFIYPRHLLGRGVGLNMMIVAVSSAIGPTIAAAILSVADWPALFAINLPIGAVALLAAVRSLPPTPRSTHEFDTASAILTAGSLGLMLAALDGGAHLAPLPLVIGAALAACLCAIVLVRRQSHAVAPMLPIDLLREPIFALSVGTSAVSFAAQMLAFVAVPYYLERTLGQTAVTTGLLLTAWPLALAAVAPFSGRLSDRLPGGLLGGIGLLVFAAGLLLTAHLHGTPGNVALAWRMAVCGLGFGLFQAPNARVIMQSAPRARSGAAGGMLATSRVIGQSIGAAVAALIFALIPVHATTLSIEVAAGCAASAACVSLLRMRV